MIRDHKILVADNKDIDAAYMRLMLERNGCKTEIVNNGQDVLEKIKSNDYSLVVMNEQLFQMDGAETVKKIRELERTGQKRTPILGLTSYSLSNEKKKFQNAGLDYCLSKPVYKNNLTDILSSIFKRQQ